MYGGDTGLLIKGLSHNSVNNGLLIEDVPITILSHQNWDFLDVPPFETDFEQKHLNRQFYAFLIICN